MIFGKIVCFFKGHKRGKEIQRAADIPHIGPPYRIFACPRCGHETRYKVKPTDDAPTPPAAWTGGV